MPTATESAPTSSVAPTVGPTAIVTPSAVATSSPGPGGTGFDIEWERQAADFGPDVQIIKSAVIDERIVVIGHRYTDGAGYGPAIWWEDGDLVWRAADLPPVDSGDEPRLSNVVAGGPGLVAVGSYGLLWLSADGRSWEAVPESEFYLPPESTLAVAVDGILATGYDDGAFMGPYVSSDGRHWRESDDPNTRHVAGADIFAGSEEQLTAFVYEDSRVGVWRAGGVESWSLISYLPDSRGVQILAAAVGPRGWVVIGSDRGPVAWTSPDGVNWELAVSPPPVPDVAFGINAGFVGVRSFDPIGGCAVDEYNTRTETWTSSDGRIWRLVSELADGAAIVSLRRRADTLIGIGLTPTEVGSVWTAHLPETSADTAAAPAPTQFAYTPTGCGG